MLEDTNSLDGAQLQNYLPFTILAVEWADKRKKEKHNDVSFRFCEPSHGHGGKDNAVY